MDASSKVNNNLNKKDIAGYEYQIEFMKKRKDTKIATVYSKFLTPKDKNLAVGSGMNQERSATTEGTY